MSEGYEVSELICLKCLKRWIGVYPADVLLKDVECKCGAVGFVVKTGQTLPDENQCETCRYLNNESNNCRLGLSGSDPFCDYKQLKEQEHEV